MPLRQIALDTETTGIRYDEGHRIIEIGCVELIDRKLTQQRFHRYINPEREIDAGAMAIHGLTTAFLADKPLFADIADELISFIDGSELIIHNASFDTGFLDNELSLLQKGFKNIADYCRITDTLQLARRMHAGQKNNLDALCKRYGVDNSKRDLHGALLDASLLAQVYLAMTGGQGTFFDSLSLSKTAARQVLQPNEESINLSKDAALLVVLKASTEENASHKKYLENMRLQGDCLWLPE